MQQVSIAHDTQLDSFNPVLFSMQSDGFPQRRVDAPVSLCAGDRIEAYQLLRQVDRGGVADIWEAFEAFTGRIVALKVMRTTDVEAGLRMRQEAILQGQLQSASMVQIFGAGALPSGQVWIAMELLRGQTLRCWLRDHEASPADAVRITRCIAEALVAVHRAGVVHRDIKPENIFVCSDGSVRLLDLGAARMASSCAAFGSATERGLTIGTPAYMAPEQFACSAVDHHADIYALGCVFGEILMGHHPLVRGESLEALDGAFWATMHRFGPVPVLEGTIQPVANIARRCMAKAPSGRYRNAGELVAALEVAEAWLGMC